MPLGSGAARDENGHAERRKLADFWCQEPEGETELVTCRHHTLSPHTCGSTRGNLLSREGRLPLGHLPEEVARAGCLRTLLWPGCPQADRGRVPADDAHTTDTHVWYDDRGLAGVGRLADRRAGEPRCHGIDQRLLAADPTTTCLRKPGSRSSSSTLPT